MSGMGHVVSRQQWGTVDIDTDSGVILVREDWRYTWHQAPGVRPFTLAQKRAFHARLDRQIWGKWSWYFRLHARGEAPFAQKFEGRTLVVNFDVRWVLHGGNWSVEVIRLPATAIPGVNRSNVTFAKREIQLFSNMFVTYEAGNDAGASRPGFRVPQHEFGHTLDSDDEYSTGSAYLQDTNSVMNIGQQLRNRHLTLVQATLNGMIPGVQFSL